MCLATTEQLRKNSSFNNKSHINGLGLPKLEALFFCLNYICRMKFGISILLTVITAQLGFAQVTDTLGYADFLEGTPSLYESPNGGYAFGNNGYQDQAKAQSYSHSSSFVLRKVLMEFGEVVFMSGDSSSAVRVNVYDNYGEGVTSLGVADSIAPDSVLGFVDVPVYQLTDDGSLSEADFSGSTIAIFNRFSVGIDLTQLSAGDTVGLVSTTDGDAMGSLDAWEQTSNGNWFTVEESAYSWGLDVDFAIFPVIDVNDPAGISDYVYGELSVFPNPCANVLNLSVPASFGGSIRILDITGKVVVEHTSIQTSGAISVEGLSPGVYSLILADKDQLHTVKFIKY